MRIFQRPATTSMGFLAQTETQSIAEMLAAPASVPVYVSLVFTAMSKANKGIQLAWNGELDEAKAAVLYYSYVNAPSNVDSAAYLGAYADGMLRKLHADGEISDQLFDQLIRTFQIPLSDVIGEASVAIISAKDKLTRTLNWVKSFFVTFESGADVFFQQQGAKVTGLYSGLEIRSRAIQALIDSINLNKAYVPNTAKTLPDLGEILAEMNSAKEAFVKSSAEVEVTPAMLRGEAALSGGENLAKIVIRNAKLAELAKKLETHKLTGWLIGPLMKLGMKRVTARFISKILWYTTIGLPKLLWSKIAHNTLFAVVIFTFGGFWLMKKFPNFFKEEIEKDDKIAVTPPAKQGVADVRTKWDDLNRQTEIQIRSAKTDFPGEAALLDQGTGDTTWVLYALGGGALAIGLYLYFNRKSQTVS